MYIYNCYIIYYAYGIIKVKYLESLLTILFVHLLFFFYNDYNNKNVSYLILSYLIYICLYVYVCICIYVCLFTYKYIYIYIITQNNLLKSIFE